MDVARPTSQGAHYHADVIYLLSTEDQERDMGFTVISCWMNKKKTIGRVKGRRGGGVVCQPLIASTPSNRTEVQSLEIKGILRILVKTDVVIPSRGKTDSFRV